jgi:GNAT superfamily N-acetyltransferase
MSSHFWNSNVYSPSWKEFVSSWVSSSPPKLLQSGSIQEIPLTPVRSCFLRKATPHDLTLLPEFYRRYFSTSMKYSCSLSVSLLQNPNWEIYVVVSNTQIIGSIIRKWLTNVHVFEVKWPKAAIVDYFCVHPSWKKKGIGRWLLSTLHNTSPTPLPPHFILWEGIQPLYPPLSIGFYLSKVCLASNPTVRSIPLTKEIWNACVKGKSVWSEYCLQNKEISVWNSPSDPILVWNTFHTSAYGPIGIVLSGSLSAIESLSNSKSLWGVLLVPHTNPFFSKLQSMSKDWSIDSPYQWISYNMVCRQFSDFPSFCI